MYLSSQSSNVFLNELARYQFWKSSLKCDANHELLNESRVKQGGTSLDKPTDTRQVFWGEIVTEGVSSDNTVFLSTFSF